jgi:hypothetical protein
VFRARDQEWIKHARLKELLKVNWNVEAQKEDPYLDAKRQKRFMRAQGEDIRCKGK